VESATQGPEDTEAPASPSSRTYARLRDALLRGDYVPDQALKPQEIANQCGVSLAVAREALLRLVGEGFAVRLPNRGFQVPSFSAARWREIAEARMLIEPGTLRLAIERGDLAWEARVRAAHHRLSGTPLHDGSGGTHYSDEWAEVHRQFHRVLLEGCENDVLLETFDRLWTASELARRWSVTNDPGRDFALEHRALEEAALDRDADEAAAVLLRHLGRTAAGLT
jgi:DNA-binding GntR family transcriptional regulator